MNTSHESAWESCLKVIKDNISLQAFKTWFEPIVPVKLEGQVLTIQVPSHFFYEWLEQHYITLLRKVIKKAKRMYLKRQFSVFFLVLKKKIKTKVPKICIVPKV